jgi:hypothetical protein
VEKKKSIFRQESLDRVESPEQLDQYIRVSKPSAWIMVAALLVASVSLLVWGFTGSLPQTITVKGITAENGVIYCYVDPSDVQDSLEGSTMTGTVSEMSSVPYSLEEVSEILQKDWIIDQLISSGYVYQLKVETEEEPAQDIIVQASIVTSEVKPIEYVMN